MIQILQPCFIINADYGMLLNTDKGVKEMATKPGYAPGGGKYQLG